MGATEERRPAFAYAYWLAAIALVIMRAAGVVSCPWWVAVAPLVAPVVAIPAIAVALAVIAGGGRHGR